MRFGGIFSRPMQSRLTRRSRHLSRSWKNCAQHCIALKWSGRLKGPPRRRELCDVRGDILRGMGSIRGRVINGEKGTFHWAGDVPPVWVRLLRPDATTEAEARTGFDS